MEELVQLRDHFQTKCDEKGRLSKVEFEEGMRQAGITDPLVIDQNFRAFDKDGSGFVDFVEYVTALSVFQKGDPEERLRLLFDLYDTDKSGKLSYNEIFQMYKAGLNAKGG